MCNFRICWSFNSQFFTLMYGFSEIEDLRFNPVGNLCRCTGYRPILDGFRTFCCKSDGENRTCCKDNNTGIVEV